MTAMSLGLAHSLSRYKLKFSPDKIDTMIVQAVSLLDDLDKELNNYIMRTREWYDFRIDFSWAILSIVEIIDNLEFSTTRTACLVVPLMSAAIFHSIMFLDYQWVPSLVGLGQRLLRTERIG